MSSNTDMVPLVEQELPTLPEHLSSPPIFSGVRVTRSLVLYVCFVDRLLPFCTFSFGHYVVSSSSIYGFWLLLWYLQTLLETPIYTVYLYNFWLLNFDTTLFLILHTHEQIDITVSEKRRVELYHVWENN